MRQRHQHINDLFRTIFFAFFHSCFLSHSRQPHSDQQTSISIFFILFFVLRCHIVSNLLSQTLPPQHKPKKPQKKYTRTCARASDETDLCSCIYLFAFILRSSVSGLSLCVSDRDRKRDRKRRSHRVTIQK